MADRYWVGGAGTWNTTSTTNWSTTSGGPGGASVPTAADSVFFDDSSGLDSSTVTLTGALACLDFNVSGNRVKTFAGTGTLAISGSLTSTSNSSAFLWTATGTVTFNATTSGKTITTNGTSFASAFTFNGVGGVWTLGSALTITNTGNFTVTAGTFDTSSTGNYPLTCAGTVTVSATGTLNLNASTVTLSSIAPFSLAGTFNAGTSTINLTASTSAVGLNGNGRTFYNVNFTGAQNASGRVHSITSQNVFNNISVVGPSVVGYTGVSFAANQTINGVLSTSGTAGNRRVWFQSATYGTQWDISVNATPSLTDADFRDLRIIGTAAPISGTRIGNLTGCSGITFSTPKTVYWNLAAGGNWSATAWATSSGGAVSTDNFPLGQDTVIIGNTGLNASAAITLDAAYPFAGTLDISGRTNAMTLNLNAQYYFYGDWKLSTAVTIGGVQGVIFGGRSTQSITSAGRLYGSNQLTIDTIGGVVQLLDAFTTTGAILHTNGTFTTNGFAVTCSQINSNVTVVRAMNLGASTITTSTTTPLTINGTNLTMDAGTSNIVVTSASSTLTLNGSALTLGTVTFNNTGVGSHTITGLFSFNNFTVTATTAVTLPKSVILSNNITIGTLTFSGATAISRLFIYSGTSGTQRTINLTAFAAGTSDIDFRDISITGAAINTSITRGGDCGGNSGITFPAPKTVYWNLAGAQNWNATAWATTSGGTPALNNFPLAQDTAVFNNTGSVTGTITIPASGVPYNLGTVDMSARTTAMTLSVAAGVNVCGDWKNGTGVTLSGTNTIAFSGNRTQTITSSGRTFTQAINVLTSGTVQLADALTTTSTLTLNLGTFDAVTFNVTATTFGSNVAAVRTIRMGTGIWTLTGTSTVWNIGTTTLTFQSGTSTVVLSDVTTTARIWSGGGQFYNKITIGGATGTSTTTFSTADTIGELAATKTVAHTVDLTGAPFIGKWSITGTVGNVVTVSGTINLVGERVSGVNYLALGTTTIPATNPVEFYAGPNSTGTGINTAAPAAVTRYWRGGTGTWDATTTTNWSATSGGAGGASVPTSADTVIFDSASNATAYTVTLTATQLRCASISISGPASGSVEFKGTAPLAVTQAFTMAATGVTNSYTGALTFAGTGTGKTISAGQSMGSNMTINGVGASWALSAALSAQFTSNFTLTNGSFDTAGFTYSFFTINTSATNRVTLSLGASALTSIFTGGGINFTNSSTTVNPVNLTFNAGTSTITTPTTTSFYHGGKTFYNVSLTNNSSLSTPLNQSAFTPTFNNLTLATFTTNGITPIPLSSNLIINGTFTITNQNNGSRRMQLASSVVGTQRTITAAVVSGLVDVDMRDINCAGTATWTGTRIGDLGGNGGSFVASTPKTVYWNLAAGGNWSATAWATSSGGAVSTDNFPLAQDTAIIQNTGLNTSAPINFEASWNIGTIDMSSRTSAMTLGGSGTIRVYGDWKYGSGVTPTHSGSITFIGRGTQTITSNGKTFSPLNIDINSVSGTLQLADAFTMGANRIVTLITGTFNSGIYNVTIGSIISSSNISRTLNMGSGTWTLAGTGTVVSLTPTALTLIKGTSNIVLSDTSAVARSIDFGGQTLNKLTIGGTTGSSTTTFASNNTFSEIASTKTVAHTISLAGTTQYVGAFTVSGSAGNLATITGTALGTQATLVYTGASTVNVNYITHTFVKAYNPTNVWYAGTNSINGGSYGWINTAAPGSYNAGGNFFVFF